ITPIKGNASPLTFLFKQSQPEHWTLSIDTLPPGLYRVAVSAKGNSNRPSLATLNSSFEVIDTSQL
ncbi:MAG: hypothetical protein AAFR12_21225, partial [Cyanobacteria bacterium J06626_6]